jgi:hypothetical protein
MLAYLREIFSLEEVGDLEVVGNTVVLGIASCHQSNRLMLGAYNGLRKQFPAKNGTKIS